MDKLRIKQQMVAQETITKQERFDDQELESMRKEYVQKNIILAEKEKAFKEISDAHKEEKKKLQKENLFILQKLDAGFQKVSIECGIVPDFATDEMIYYNLETGNEEYRRKMMPNEKQHNIHSIAQ